ncbi:MAG: hypothetical protein GKS05_03210 [Nitrospirales bacterium]|nr:hypothetical protein [Nitrospirales bacterium]
MTAESLHHQWQPIGAISTSSLLDARLQLHWAVQIVGSFGNTVLEPQADDSQSNLGWVDSQGALCSHASSDGICVGLRLADLTLLFFTPQHTTPIELRLSAQTLQQALVWLATTYAQASGSAAPKPFALRDYDMPAHPVAQGMPFSMNDSVPYQELHRWYSNANSAIHEITAPWSQALPIRCWPHHFDIATLVALDPEKGSEDARSVGCGMSPGDHTYPEPYFYVTPWPYPKKETLPALSGGFWHTEGWVGAILTTSVLTETKSNETQAQQVQQFFHDGTQAAFVALGATPV